MRKIATVIGARPQFIKAAPVSRAIASTGGLQEVVIHTGQHFDDNMSRVFFDQMQIARPDYHLDIHSLPHGAMTGRMLEGIERILQEEKPHYLMVYGDTNSTLAGALAASKLHIPIAHVEAGLRSFNMNMPEEINRIITDRMSRLLFCPTPAAMKNLAQEGFERFSCKPLLTGDVMYDASLCFREKAVKPGDTEIPASFILTTVHREENTRNHRRLANIIGGLNNVAEEMCLVFPMHPGTKKQLEDGKLPPLSKNIITTTPCGYLEMLYLLQKCQMVMTDSGGLQKEAYFFGKPCITLREETEWTELTDAGYNKLCNDNPDNMVNAFREFIRRPPVFSGGLYGDGDAAGVIAKELLSAGP